jgi:hypothetical protein
LSVAPVNFRLALAEPVEVGAVEDGEFSQGVFRFDEFPGTFWWRENSVTALADAAIAVKFDLVGPLLARWQSRHRLALHRRNERRFCALPNSLVIHRLQQTTKLISDP